MSLTFSDLQYPMLQVFADAGPGYYMSVEEARKFDQRPFRSMIYRSPKRPDPWVAFRPGRGFHITREGRDAWNDYHSRNILRANPSLPLTSYFDPTAYGLNIPKKPAKGGSEAKGSGAGAKLHVLKKRSA